MTPIHVAVVSLGCAKNLVNSEQMMYLLREAGFHLTGDTARANVNIVNTCGFIESARQEAVDQILELTAMPGKIIVAGCLTELVKDEIFTELPEVSAIVGCGSFDRIVEAVRAVLNGQTFQAIDPTGGPVSETPRLVTSCYGECGASGEITANSTYLKLSEGCSNHCSYCAIPSIRGPHVSRPMESILAEAAHLTDNGVKELILVAQDLTRYGEDLYGSPKLCELLRGLCKLEKLLWLRLHYLYPSDCTDELIDVIASEEKIVKYVDMPIQHCSDEILQAMNRRGNKELLLNRIRTMREKVPDIVIRTTIITGFPGESEEHHRELCEFLQEVKLPRVGVFTYSQEPGTPAADLPQIPDDVKQRRQEQLMAIQQDVLDEYNQSMLGRILEVLCEGHDRFAGTYYGRSYGESPDVDGKIFFSTRVDVEPGEMVRVKITDIENGDLFGKMRG